MISKSAQILLSGLKIIQLKDRVDFVNPPRSKVPKVPCFSSHHILSTSWVIQERKVIHFSPKGTLSNKQVIFLHGGGYSIEGSELHFRLIKKLMDTSNASFTYVDYPLAPESNVDTTLQMVMESYETLIKTYPNQQFILMGDSAGGGLALALALQIKERKIQAPEKIILLSPWLDLELTNPKIQEYVYEDMILDVEALLKIGEIYKGNHSFLDPMVSPKYGNFDGLGDITIFTGTSEIFYPDCVELKVQHAHEQVKIDIIVYEDMPHDWLLLPLPESKKAIQEVAEIIRK